MMDRVEDVQPRDMLDIAAAHQVLDKGKNHSDLLWFHDATSTALKVVRTMDHSFAAAIMEGLCPVRVSSRCAKMLMVSPIRFLRQHMTEVRFRLDVDQVAKAWP